ncbi:hypothetical protein M409DRAFT_29476 [Zasmidium cellare ATCC 36951]|uniref:Uncharacterized protein n=1 Tax=Zasmidium cellare ATCC 36951 TaxID=1080233 RepID=A0A6A6C2D9_ZASCE|nr:uncharacterized protein M409DRAFT_29476 [Zasmidium cellare ATCC 36951]KAF2160022.1 hypothetical protein M409DRAFT_29476 [Zasmidium cellare ATCC 36951]
MPSTPLDAIRLVLRAANPILILPVLLVAAKPSHPRRAWFALLTLLFTVTSTTLHLLHRAIPFGPTEPPTCDRPLYPSSVDVITRLVYQCFNYHEHCYHLQRLGGDRSALTADMGGSPVPPDMEVTGGELPMAWRQHFEHVQTGSQRSDESNASRPPPSHWSSPATSSHVLPLLKQSRRSFQGSTTESTNGARMHAWMIWSCASTPNVCVLATLGYSIRQHKSACPPGERLSPSRSSPADPTVLCAPATACPKGWPSGNSPLSSSRKSSTAYEIARDAWMANSIPIATCSLYSNQLPSMGRLPVTSYSLALLISARTHGPLARPRHYADATPSFLGRLSSSRNPAGSLRDPSIVDELYSLTVDTADLDREWYEIMESFTDPGGSSVYQDPAMAYVHQSFANATNDRTIHLACVGDEHFWQRYWNDLGHDPQ